MEIKLATLEHFDGIRALLKANHVNTIDPELKKDGFVTTNLTDEQLTTLIVDKQGVTIAEEDGKVLAFALAADWDYWSAWPFFQYMIEHLEEYQLNGETLTVENSYQYGPVCVDHSVRGTGVFEKVFNFSLATMENRYPYMVTFVNQINPRSYNAHSNKAKMATSGTFDFNNNHYYLMACPTKRGR